MLLPFMLLVENNCWPNVCFGGSKPNKSFVILWLVSFSSARGSKSLSESELIKRPSNLVPTLGLNASSVLFIYEMENVSMNTT